MWGEGAQADEGKMQAPGVLVGADTGFWSGGVGLHGGWGLQVSGSTATGAWSCLLGECFVVPVFVSPSALRQQGKPHSQLCCGQYCEVTLPCLASGPHQDLSGTKGGKNDFLVKLR